MRILPRIVGRPGEDVEHYRPKNLYWFLAYAPTIYLSSCRRCNSSRKINRFPLQVGAVPATDEAQLRRERRLLLDPAQDDVERVLRIELTSKEYNWEVNPAASKRLRTRADRTIEFFRLNTDTELRRARIEAIQAFFDEVLSAHPPLVQRARRRISRFAPHGAAVRSVALQQHPALVPTDAEEMQWHITDLAANLDMADRADPDPTFIEIQEFALATIRADPPRGVARRDVATWFDTITITSGTLAGRVGPIVTELRVAP